MFISGKEGSNKKKAPNKAVSRLDWETGIVWASQSIDSLW